MKKENEINLLITKINSVSLKKRNQLLEILLESIGSYDDLIDWLNYKPMRVEDKNYSEGDWIYISPNISSYPRPCVEYYENNNLIDKDGKIRVKVVRISPVDNYTWLEFYTDLAIVSKVKVYNGNIDKQEDLFLF
jgi:hypothetical protein